MDRCFLVLPPYVGKVRHPHRGLPASTYSPKENIMDLSSFKEKITAKDRPTVPDGPVELDAEFLELVSGGELAATSHGGGGGFANATWSKAI